MHTIRRTAVLAATAALTLSAAPSAFASGSAGGGGVQRTGHCSAASTWKLAAKPNNGRLEIGFEVDSNRVGQTWRIRLADNGTTFFTGTRKTVAPSGSFNVNAFTANRAGVDHITAVATNAATGETCRGAVSL